MDPLIPSPALATAIPVDEHHGLGGDYVMQDGVRTLVRRAGMSQDADPAEAATPADTEPRSHAPAA